MARNATNQLLKKVKKSKSDEFYTQLSDIERELQYYQNSFRGKVVYCNCDDPHLINFFHYFVINFKVLGLRKLIAACYNEHDNGLFSSREIKKYYFCEYSRETDEYGRARLTECIYFKDNGDFRNKESVELLKKADIVVTNPPFSLFREYIAQLVKYDKQFLVIGNINAITYKEIFELIQKNKVWLGINLGRGISGFIVPKHYNLYGTEVCVNNEGQTIIATNNCLWLTNLELLQRHEDINLTKNTLGMRKNIQSLTIVMASILIELKIFQRTISGLWKFPLLFFINTILNNLKLLDSEKVTMAKIYASMASVPISGF